MSTLIRRRRGSRMNLSAYKRHELLTGRIEPMVPAYSGYATTGTRTNLVDYISDEMRADWRMHREVLIAFWTSGVSDVEAFPDDTPPWLCLGPRDRLPWAEQHLDGGRTGDA
jgi:hypothetical protein